MSAFGTQIQIYSQNKIILDFNKLRFPFGEVYNLLTTGRKFCCKDLLDVLQHCRGFVDPFMRRKYLQLGRDVSFATGHKSHM